jgi:hypothetical protein
MFHPKENFGVLNRLDEPCQNFRVYPSEVNTISQSVWRLGNGLDCQGSIPDRGKLSFLFSTASKPALVAHPVTYKTGTGGSLHGGKAAGA